MWIVHYLSHSEESICQVAGNRAAHREFETKSEAVEFASEIKRSGSLVFEFILLDDSEAPVCYAV